MKRNAVLLVLIGVTSILSIVKKLDAQQRWIPKSMLTQIPMVLKEHSFSSVPGHSNKDTNIEIGWRYSFRDPPFQFESYTVSDTLFSYHFKDTVPDYHEGVWDILVQFSLDTINSQIHSLRVTSSFDTSFPSPVYPTTAHERYIFQYSTLNFQRLDDTITVEKMPRSSVAQMLDTAYYWSNSSTVVNGKDGSGYGGTNETISILYDDTASFYLFTKFVLEGPQAVASQLKLSEKLKVLMSIGDNSLHFTIPEQNTESEMTIYDVLGREAVRVVIPPGVGSYTMHEHVLKSGYYFARLGAAGTSFIVN